MTVINYTYGVLADGFTTGEKPVYGRYSTARRSKKQAEYLNTLLPVTMPKESLCCNVELLIDLLRCSELWPTYAASWDKNNTYRTTIEMPTASAGLLSYKDLLAWCDNTPLTSNLYAVRLYDTGPDRICNTLFNVLTLK